MTRRQFQMFALHLVIIRTHTQKAEKRNKLDARPSTDIDRLTFPTALGAAVQSQLIWFCRAQLKQQQPAALFHTEPLISRWKLRIIWRASLNANRILWWQLNSNLPATNLTLERLQIAIHFEQLVNVLNLHFHWIAHLANRLEIKIHRNNSEMKRNWRTHRRWLQIGNCDAQRVRAPIQKLWQRAFWHEVTAVFAAYSLLCFVVLIRAYKQHGN